MPISISAFADACHDVHRRLVEEGLTSDPSSHLVGLAFFATGGFQGTVPGEREMTDVQFQDAVDTGTIHELAEQCELKWLRHLVVDRHISEEFLVIGSIRYIEHFLEEQASTTSRQRRRLDAEREKARALLSDPSAREASAANINRMLPPEVPRVSPNDLLRRNDEMFDAYSPPATPEHLKLQVRRLSLWREIALPLIAPAGF